MRIQRRVLAVNAITVFTLLLGIEVLAGIGMRKPSFIPVFLLTSFRYYYMTEDRSILHFSECAEYDPELFYRFRDSCDFINREFDVTCRFNSKGLRDDEMSLDDSLIFFGDSFTMGWGVNAQNAYPERIELILNTSVLNAGMTSFGTAREMLLLKRLS